MTNKFYAVRKGRKIGIFKTWDECQKQTVGFSGAEFKSFTTEQDANEYISNKSVGDTVNNEAMNNSANPTVIVNKNTCTAYVDGSFNTATNRYGWGLVIFTKETNIPDTSCGGGTIAELATMRNIAGEIIASSKAIERAIKLGFKEIHIYHDYTGISKWATSEWKANKEYTKRYAKFCQDAMKKINIVFHWVKGHSENQYNDMADSLAKKGAHIA